MPTTPDSFLRAYVSFSALAEDILGLSRARLYELIDRGAMPHPCYDLRSRRPIFTRQQQEQALAVLRSGQGIDGQPIVFYRRQRRAAAAPAPQRTRARSSRRGAPQYDELISSLQALGINHADEVSVAAAVAECFPNGVVEQQEPDVLRTLFRHLRRRESA